tara:strand:- start:18981 stop:20708 length:1728 start_codon:yes stop_codon:yes gene_type:complete
MKAPIHWDNIPEGVSKDYVTDFRNHLFACFKYLFNTEPTPLQYAMADKLQSDLDGFQLQAGRGAGKSVLTASFASWLLLRNPNVTIMVLSASAMKSTEFVSMTRRILSVVPYMKHLEPGPNTPDSAFGFNVETRSSVNQDKSVFARGVSGQITGSHADWVIIDDVEIEKNSHTAEARERLLNKVWEIEQIRNPGDGGGIRILGTPQNAESIYNKMREGYPIHKYPALMPDEDMPGQVADCSEYILELELEPGASTQPERFSDETLSERRAKIGPKLFSLHYHLDTSLADADRYPLRLSDLLVIDCDKEQGPSKMIWATKEPVKNIPSFGLSGDVLYEPMWISTDYLPYRQIVMHVDPSGRGADETAVAITAYLNGYVFVLDLLGLEGGYDAGTLKKIIRIAEEYNVDRIMYESNFGDAMFGQLLIPVAQSMGCTAGIDEYRVSGAKEKRIISTLEPVMGSHRLVFDKRAIRSEETQRQITRITEIRGSLKHDDRVDALGSAVKYWEDALALNVDAELEKVQDKKDLDMINSWQDDDRRMLHFLPEERGAVRINGKFPGRKRKVNPLNRLKNKYRR